MRIQNDRILRLVSAVGELDARRVEEEVLDLLAQGLEPQEIRKSIDVGMKLVGEYFRSGEYFLADLLYAGGMYKNILQLKEMRGKAARSTLGKALIGPAPGDGHEILQDIVSSILKSTGFEVVDLGFGSTAESFQAAFDEHEPKLVVIGCTGPSSRKELGRLIRKIRDRDKGGARILLEGPSALAQDYRELGADSFCKDAIDSLEICMSFMA